MGNFATPKKNYYRRGRQKKKPEVNRLFDSHGLAAIVQAVRLARPRGFEPLLPP